MSDYTSNQPRQTQPDEPQPSTPPVEANQDGSSRPLVLVTGASSGIGAELSKVFAAEGYDLVLAAEDDLTATVETVQSSGAEASAVRVDLRTTEGVEDLYAAVVAAGRPLAAAALNAGVGQGGGFIANSLQQSLDVVRLNVLGTVHLAKLVLDDMVGRHDGRILITSSVASTMPGSYQAVYNASKSFTQSFSEALHEELRGTGVTVTALMPGPTDTEFFTRADLDDTAVGRGSKDDPAQVARQGYDAMIKGERKVQAGGLLSKAMKAAAGVLPDALKSRLHTQMSEPGSGS